MDSSTRDAADTPYRRARQEWDDRIGSAIVHAHNWRRATFASTAVTLAAVVGLVVLGAQPKAVPHVIEIDGLGRATYRGPVGAAGDQYTPTEAVIEYHLRRFLEDTRTISSDLAVLKESWLDAYHLVTPRGAHMLSAFVERPENDPFRRVQEERVTVELLAAVRVSGDTWQLDWRETAFDNSGAPSDAPALWRGMFHVVLRRPKTEEEMMHNPIGLYVDEFHWDKVASTH
ncbi:MAG TPA: conjugal transfer protein TrbF [Polyangiaceae bacterium]|nr:conjugal transfer protein TrbF [Polyangiaceae bacterium]